jgi:hypothetical protein
MGDGPTSMATPSPPCRAKSNQKGLTLSIAGGEIVLDSYDSIASALVNNADLIRDLAIYGTALGALFSAGWAILTFRKNNRIKSIELLISLEGQFKEYVELLTDIESNYLDKYHEALFRESEIREPLYGPPARLSAYQDAVIECIDKMLRHFLICKQVRDFRLDGKTLDRSYAYYLTKVLCTENHPELQAYIRHYWKSIYFWSIRLRKGWFMYMWLRIKDFFSST